MTATDMSECAHCAAARARVVRDEHLRRAWHLVEPDRPSDRARAQALEMAIRLFLASPAARALAPSREWSDLRTALWHAAHASELPTGWRQILRVSSLVTHDAGDAAL